MMELEIDRRCPDCGAAVRSNAAFCPQCGRAMKSATDSGTEPTEIAEGAEQPPIRSMSADKSGANSTRPLHVTNPGPGPIESSSTTSATAAPPAPPKPEPISLPAQVAREQIASGQVLEPLPAQRARKPGQRVVGAAREVVEERLGPRVEKLRQASTVVWGEAQDDPNLRFILVAVFLFILALVIILLGTYLR